MISSVVKHSWNFDNFRNLVLILPEVAIGGFLIEKGIVKFRNTHRKTPVSESLFTL